jgi:hypothetical protein
MLKRRVALLLGIGILASGIGLAVFLLVTDRDRQLTFEECEKAGGAAWLVDPYHPDICPACAEFRACEQKSNADPAACPQLEACTVCLEANFPYPATCPDGKEKIGEISDAAIWFQCCK